MKRNNPFSLFNKNKKMNNDSVDSDKKEEPIATEIPIEENTSSSIEDSAKTNSEESKGDSSD